MNSNESKANLSEKGLLLFQVDNFLHSKKRSTVEYLGSFEVLGRSFNFRICTDKGLPDLPTFMVDNDLHKLLDPLMSAVWPRLAQADSLEAFFLDLQRIIETAMHSSTSPDGCVTLAPPEYYSRLINELEDVGWEKLASLDDSLNCIVLNVNDPAKRSHRLQLQLPSDYPHSAPQVIADLPSVLQLRWVPGRSRLNDALTQFQETLKTLQDFWQVLDDFDEHTWVLEPEHPQRGVPFRRVALHQQASVVVTINPLRPLGLCEIRFLGSEASVAPLRTKLSKGMHSWDPSKLPRINLEYILGAHFPSPQTSKKEDFKVECGICYSFHLPVQAEPDVETSLNRQPPDPAGILTPDCICNNPKCARGYHPICLFEWLQSLPSSRVLFDTVFGQCPYCSEPISVKSQK